jgi:hypothetical protein
MCIMFGVRMLIFYYLLNVLIFCVGKICMKDGGLLLVSRSLRVSFHFHNSNKLPKSQIGKICIYFLLVTFVPTFFLFFNCMKLDFKVFIHNIYRAMKSLIQNIIMVACNLVFKYWDFLIAMPCSYSKIVLKFKVLS